jgi:4-hydroxy-4-methyl-2-oxoglutarate aldolase
MNAPHTAAQLEALRRIDSCTLANAIESFRVRLRNEGFASGDVRCLFPKLPPMVGYAVTLRTRGASPPVTGSATYVENTEWWNQVLAVPAPRVIVVEDVSSVRGRGALLGEVHVSLLRAMGCVGAVTNGAVRDVPAVERLGFNFFAAALSVSHSYVHIVEAGQPVQIDGLTIHSGDLLHGDLHGVQAIPHELVADLPAMAAAITARERKLIDLAQSPDVSIEQLRAAVAGQTKL